MLTLVVLVVPFFVEAAPSSTLAAVNTQHISTTPLAAVSTQPSRRLQMWQPSTYQDPRCACYVTPGSSTVWSYGLYAYYQYCCCQYAEF